MTNIRLLGGLLLAVVLGAPLSAAAQAPTVEYYHVDALGSVRAVTNASGGVVRRHDYAPFGEDLATVLGVDQRRFVGKERDAETGLDYSMARFYAAKWGRFTTADPSHVGGNLLDPQSWNAYGYGRNNALRFTDPLGLYVFDSGATEAEKQAFRDALGAAQNACKHLSGTAATSVCDSVSAYGIEAEDNGVVVSFGKLKSGTAGTATFIRLRADGQVEVKITVDLKQALGRDDLALHVAHEGRHAGDYQAFWRAVAADPRAANDPKGGGIIGGPLDLTGYEMEYRGYMVTANAARALGISNHKLLINGMIPDTAAIERTIKNKPYQLTPANPGARISNIAK